MTTLKEYPYWSSSNEADAREQLRTICNIRKDDITQFQNLQNIFISGRKVGKIPSASNDVNPEDKIGDFNVTESYAYFLIDNASMPEWRRVAMGSW